jgi:hypothetical protein
MILMRRNTSRVLQRLSGAVRGVPSSSNLDSISHFAEQNLETGGQAAEHTAVKRCEPWSDSVGCESGVLPEVIDLTE